MLPLVFNQSMTKSIDGVIAGYDPGGNNCHGLALAQIRNGRCASLECKTMESADAVLTELETVDNLVAFGIDTLAAWATGPSGWRAADLWLRERYADIRASIVSPNGLYGSMGINGMAVLTAIQKANTEIHVTETHPKVLYRAMTGEKYNYTKSEHDMDNTLAQWLNYPVKTANDHEWDAVVSVFAALRGLTGVWSHDLFDEQSQRATGRLVFPSGKAYYWWPE